MTTVEKADLPTFPSVLRTLLLLQRKHVSPHIGIHYLPCTAVRLVDESWSNLVAARMAVKRFVPIAAQNVTLDIT